MLYENWTGIKMPFYYPTNICGIQNGACLRKKSGASLGKSGLLFILNDRNKHFFFLFLKIEIKQVSAKSSRGGLVR